MEKKEIKKVKKLLKKDINEKTRAFIFTAVRENGEGPLCYGGSSAEIVAMLFSVLTKLNRKHIKAFSNALIDLLSVTEALEKDDSNQAKGETENEQQQ